MPRSLAPRGQCPESIPVSVLPQGSPGRPGLCPFLWHGFLMRLRVRDPSAQRAVAVGQWGNVGWGCGGALQCPLWEGTARSWESGSDVGPPPSPCSRSPRSRKPTARRGGCAWRACSAPGPCKPRLGSLCVSHVLSAHGLAAGHVRRPRWPTCCPAVSTLEQCGSGAS